MSRLTRLSRTLLAVLMFACAGSVAAQQQGSGSDPSAQKQKQSQIDQPGNNSPVWRDVKTGESNYTTDQGRESGVLIQPQARFLGQSVMTTAGEAWRKYRNGPIMFYGGLLLGLVCAVLGLIYLSKGPLTLHEKPTGRMIPRFSTVERWAHWSTAISFCVLAISGLTMMFGKHVVLPVLGYTLFAWLTLLFKNLHNFVAPLFIVSVLVMILVYVKDNFPAAGDLAWFGKAPGMMLSNKHVPSGRYNGGEKAWFWGGVVVLGIVSAVSGAVLLFPNFEQLRVTMQQAHVVHAVSAMLLSAGAIGHIYMGTIGVEGAYQSMRTGFVDEIWAKEHHELWYNEVKGSAGPAPSGGAVPAGAPQRRQD